MDKEQFLKEESYKKVIYIYIIIFMVISVFLQMIISIPLKTTLPFAPLYQYLVLQFSTIHNLIIYLCLTTLIVYTLYNILKEDFKNIKSYKKTILIGLGTFFAILIGNIISSIINALLGIEGVSVGQNSIEIMVANYTIPTLIAVGICGPIVEELVFRKSIFGIIKNQNHALIVSAFIFGFMHVLGAGDFINVIPYIISGLILGMVYIASNKNIYALILGHMAVNIIAVLSIISI